MCPTLPPWEPVLTEAKCVESPKMAHGSPDIYIYVYILIREERLQLIKDFLFSCFLQYGGEDAVRLLLDN